MNREIKFRAWSPHFKRMCIFNDIDPKVFWDDEANFNSFSLKADSFILMQYTGLKDKNGVEIYEGDILDWYHYTLKMQRAKVIFQRGTFYLIGGCNDGPLSHFGDIEAIGNIYENPELLND